MALSTLDIFLNLLKSGLYATPLGADDVPADTDWQAILDMARRQTVVPLVADAAARLPQELRPPQAVSTKMMGISLRVMQAHALLDRTVAFVAKTYADHGIRGVLLKGQGVARCYPNPQLRQCGDIDLYVGLDKYPEACRLALELLHDGDRADSSENYKHFEVRHDGVSIEIHKYAATMRTPWRDHSLQRWVHDQIGHPESCVKADFCGVEVELPTAQFNAFFIFYHAWHHLLEMGLGLRQLCDLAMVLHNSLNQIDRPRLEADIRAMGMVKAWQTIGWILVNRLGLPAHEMPLYDDSARVRGERAFDMILSDGNFGQYVDLGVLSPKASDRPLVRKVRGFARRTVRGLHTFSLDPVEVPFYIGRYFIGGVGRLFKSDKL